MLSEILSKEGLNTNLATDTLPFFRASYDFQRNFDTFDYIRGQEKDAYRPVAMASAKRVKKDTAPGNDAHMQEKVRQYVANTDFRKTEADWFAPMVFTSAGHYLEQVKEAQPFFLVVDSFDVHEPWDPPKKYVDLYDDPDYRGVDPIVPNYSDAGWISDRELKRMRALYVGEVTMMDHWLGNFLNKIDDLGLTDNTLLMVLSDHGVALGEHNATGKPFWALWSEMTDTIFYIRHPEGKGAGKTSDYYASTHDVAPTVLSMLDIQAPQEMNGTDLSPILEGKEPSQRRDHFTLGYNNYSWARDDKYVMFSTNTGASAKLYDLEKDPDQKKDLSGKHPEIIKKMFNDYVLKDAGGPLPNY